MKTLKVKPSTTTVTYGNTSTTTVTYGEAHTDTEKIANNDSSVDSDKTTWSIKQVFKWE